MEILNIELKMFGNLLREHIQRENDLKKIVEKIETIKEREK